MDETNPEDVLRAYKIDYRKRDDGTLVVHGDVNFSSGSYFRLPNLSTVIVEGHFFCYNNSLTSLEGAPAWVGGRFSCSDNLLRTLKGAPEYVGENFHCHNNELTSLENAPRHVGETFYCSHNKLSNLEHAPAHFAFLQSDFGVFESWKEVPDSLAPETKSLIAREQDNAIQDSLVLQAPLQTRKTLRFIPKP